MVNKTSWAQGHLQGPTEQATGVLTKSVRAQNTSATKKNRRGEELEEGAVIEKFGS